MPEHQEFVNDLLEHTPESWDADGDAESIALAYLRHLEDEVKRLGGCLNGWCCWDDGEPCDHGYLETAVSGTPANASPVALGPEINT